MSSTVKVPSIATVHSLYPNAQEAHVVGLVESISRLANYEVLEPTSTGSVVDKKNWLEGIGKALVSRQLFFLESFRVNACFLGHIPDHSSKSGNPGSR
jgi:hypothetical protein